VPRVIEAGDVAAVAELINEATPELPVDEATIRRWLTDPAQDVEFALFERDGEPVAYADVGMPAQKPDRAWVDLRIPRRHVDDRLLDEIVSWSERVARRGGRSLVRAYVISGSPLIEHLERHGYRPIRFAFEMRIDLEGAPPEPRWPDGLSVGPLGEGEERRAYEVSEEAFADHWEFTPSTWEHWAHHMLGEELFDRDLWLIARDEDELAGVCLCRPQATGRPGVGYVADLAVRRPWRRRGLGRALLVEAFGRFHRRGVKVVTLSVDGENTTGAVRLYESVGMRVEHRADVYERRLG
jgi:ribosomal protein S18 acetylase RimI-like enzyme